jgi:hypothetical protein
MTAVQDADASAEAVEPADEDRPVVGDGAVLLREPGRAPRLPPRWFIRLFWVMHRAVHSVTGGRFGLRTARADRWGMLRIRTVGRRTGEERTAILGYLEDGPNLVTLAMNGWANLSLRGGSTCRRIPAPGSICLVGRARSRDASRTGPSERACGPSGSDSTRAPTATPPCDPAKRRSSSSSQ